MTLIIGIRCRDGIVLGADSLATYATPYGQQTIKQQTSKKLHIIGENVVLGVAGPVGLGQSYKAEIESVIASKQNRAWWKSSLEARTYLHSAMWKYAKPAWESAEIVGKSMGQIAMQDCNHQSVVAFPAGGNPFLVQFTPQCLPEDATEGLPFVSIGSGQTAADPFLAFIRRVFWGKEQPSLNDGIFSAVWTLDYAINAQASGIGRPLQIVTLTKNNEGKWTAQEIPERDLGEHEENIRQMESGLKDFLKNADGEATAAPIPTQ